MADVRGKEDLALRLPRQKAFAVSQRSVFERGVDEDLVLAVRQLFQSAVAQAESPGLLVIGRAVGDQIGLVRQREEALPQLLQWKLLVDRHAVVENVQVVLLEIHDLAAGRVLDPGVADVPLAGHGPVEDRRAGGDLMDLQGDALADSGERPADTVARDAAADGIEPRDEAVHLLAAHPRSPKNGRLRSFSEITVTGSGHGIAKPGSSQRYPRAASGA